MIRRGPADAEGGRLLLGMALMALAMLLVPALDVIAKLLMDRLSPAQVTAGRFVAQTLVLLPIVLCRGALRRPRSGHLAAGACIGLALFTFNLAIREMPIANALAIFFVEPFLLAILARLLLGEALSLSRLAAIAFGFGGALLVLHPNLEAHGKVAVWPFATAVFFALSMLTARVMARGGGLLTLQFWTGAIAAVLLLSAAALSPGGEQVTGPLDLRHDEIALFGALGPLAAVTHQLIVRALSLVQPGTLAPFQYLELVSATVLGWAVFGTFPDGMTLLGALVIVLTGLWVVGTRTRRTGRPAPVGRRDKRVPAQPVSRGCGGVRRRGP